MLVTTLPQTTSPFDTIRQVDGNTEYWSARELMPLLGYSKWDNFEKVINRAIQACTNTNNDERSHFLPSEKVVRRRQGGGCTLQDFKLSRYGAYLISMNGDPRKVEIALAQSYFATKTYEAEKTVSAISNSTSSIEMLLTQNLMQLSALCQQNNSALNDVQVKLAAIEAEREKAEAELVALPEPTGDINPLTTRINISRLVRSVVVAKGIPYDDTWRYIYREFRDRYSIDLVARSRNTRKPGAKKATKNCLDICQELGKLDELYAVAVKLMAGDLSHLKKEEEQS